jgi:hypothetical protein
MFKLMIHSLSTYLASLCSTGYDCGPATCYLSNRVVQCACPPGFYGDRYESTYDIIINISLFPLQTPVHGSSTI